MRYLPKSPAERQEMLTAIGARSIEELFETIPEKYRLRDALKLPGPLSEAEVMAWALPRAANQFWMLSEPERATAFLQTTRNRVTTPAARATLDALSATFTMCLSATILAR